MHILDKFNIVPVPLNQLPGNNLPPVPKKDSILPAILIFTGIIIFGAIAYHYYMESRVKEVE